jgi:hypothetical protein
MGKSLFPAGMVIFSDFVSVKIKASRRQEPGPALIPVVAQSVSQSSPRLLNRSLRYSRFMRVVKCEEQRRNNRAPHPTTEPPVCFERELVSLWPPLLAAPFASIATQQVSSPAANVSN